MNNPVEVNPIQAEQEMPELTYEQALVQLESIVTRLEKGDVTLDDSVALFQKGMTLAKFCSGKLSAIEHQISQLVTNEEGAIQESPFGEPDV